MTITAIVPPIVMRASLQRGAEGGAEAAHVAGAGGEDAVLVLRLHREKFPLHQLQEAGDEVVVAVPPPPRVIKIQKVKDLDLQAMTQNHGGVAGGVGDVALLLLPLRLVQKAN